MAELTSPHFKEQAATALTDPQLQKCLGRLKAGFRDHRADALAMLPEFDDLRARAREIKDHTLAHLDTYLEIFEEQVQASGGQVHWARSHEDARQIIGDICKAEKARKVLKGKSMITEEISLNTHLEDLGMEVLETDLGEYIIQLRNEPPSHIVAPAFHLSKEVVSDLFRECHEGVPPDRDLSEAPKLLEEARWYLRNQFLTADVGITGANLMVAETGSTVIVTNEGNGDLTQGRTRCHIVVASMEKVVPTLEDATTVLRLLARSATGQEMSVYTTFSTGPRRQGDVDGPESFHVVLLDAGRSEVLGTDFQDMLRCIRCGACMNHCPVYGAVGGHAYGWVYPGPIGAVLNPQLVGVKDTTHLPAASSFCGRCEEVCPMQIPLPRLMRQWRERAFADGHLSRSWRWGLKLWGNLAKRPWLYRQVTRWSSRLLRMLGRSKGFVRRLPFGSGWSDTRDFPTPTGKTFFERYKGE